MQVCLAPTHTQVFWTHAEYSRVPEIIRNVFSVCCLDTSLDQHAIAHRFHNRTWAVMADLMYSWPNSTPLVPSRN